MADVTRLVLAMVLLTGCARKPAGTYATLKTSMGVITIRLYTDKAPKTCENFVGLATGKKAWKDPKTKTMVNHPLYDGVEFHRVMPGFMIQTGDPSGEGHGGAGFEIPDEFAKGLKYDRPGLVGMANWGPNTNSSQFFITLGKAHDLDSMHPMFGEVVDGLAVAEKIAKVPRNELESSNRPLKPVYLELVTIEVR
ncbi:MAG: peptidylprolyl isomerase [Elusimicrobia bacterium]|nr:peptidylprolyl isomerase [Elusimicrobiota bacterium]